MLKEQHDAETLDSPARAGGESTAAEMDAATMAKIDDARRGRSAKVARSVIEAVGVGGPNLQILRLAHGLAGLPANIEDESERNVLE